MNLRKSNDPAIKGDPGQNVFGISEHILGDIILQNVAHDAWQKELTSKFKQPYVCKWATNQSIHMFHIRPDDLLDNALVTPRGMSIEHDTIKSNLEEDFGIQKEPTLLEERYANITKFPHYQKNA